MHGPDRIRLPRARRREGEGAAREPAAARADARALASVIGNRAFSDLVGRRLLRSETAAGAPAATAGPRRITTGFGTFDVFPDDATSVPVARPGRAQVWPIREALFLRLEAFMRGLDSAEPSAVRLLAAEDETFAAKVKLDLAWLQTQPLGADLIDAIGRTGKQLFIQWYPGKNATGPPVRPEGEEEKSFIGEDGRPGPGTNAKIKYNPDRLEIHDGTEPWMRRPPAIGLAHELVHAWTMMTGTRRRTEAERERQATGLGEFADAEFTENRFRDAFGLPQRPRE